MVTMRIVEHGVLDPTCPEFLGHGDTCEVYCNPGYTKSNDMICDGVRLEYPKCFRADTQLCSNTCLTSSDGVCNDGFGT